MTPLQIFKAIVNALSSNSALQKLIGQLIPQSFYAGVYTTATHVSASLHVVKEVVDPSVTAIETLMAMFQSAEMTAVEALVPGLTAHVADMAVIVNKTKPVQALVDSLTATIDGILPHAAGSAVWAAIPQIVEEVQTFVTAETYVPAPTAITTKAIIAHVKIQAATAAIVSQHAPAPVEADTAPETGSGMQTGSLSDAPSILSGPILN